MAKSSGAPAPAAAPMAPPPLMPFVAPGQVPMSVAMPPPAPAKKSGMAWLVALAVAAGGYYYYTHNMNPQATQPGQQPPQQVQPQPGGDPGQQPGNPGQQPQQQPGGQGNNPNQAIIQAQHWTANYNAVNGAISVAQGQWQNGSNVPLEAAKLECVQENAQGQGLNQMQTVLNGPLPPGETMSFPTFQIGTIVQGATKVNCGIVDVETQN
jgi:hypothetical protein